MHYSAAARGGVVPHDSRFGHRAIRQRSSDWRSRENCQDDWQMVSFRDAASKDPLRWIAPNHLL